MEILFWGCTVIVVCIITGVLFCKPYLGIVFVIVFIPFEGMVDFGYISIYPLEAILSIFLLVCICKSIARGGNYFGNKKLLYCSIPFVFCLLLSAVKSMEFSLAVKELVRWLELFLIYYLTINLIDSEKKIRIILYSIFFTMAVVSTCGIVSYCNSVGYAYWGHRASAPFGNPNPFAAYISLIIPVLFGAMMTSVLLWERIMFGVLAVVSIIAWFLSFSKSSWLFLILTMVLVFSLTKGKRKAPLYLAIFFAIFVITIVFSDIKGNFMNREKSHPVLSSLKYRVICYPIGFSMVKDDLICGIGNYPLLIKKFTIFDDTTAQNHLHNLFLQLFVDTGFMGLSAFVIWLVYIVRYLVGSLKVLKDSRIYGLYVGLMGGIIAYLFNNLVDVLVVHGIHLQWGIILGLAVVLIQFRESEKCSKTV